MLRDLDFKNIKASEGVYGIHPYPAMFHYRVVREVINEFSKQSDIIFDPFVGSGVSAVESIIHGRNFVGFDINPLAVLIAKVRTKPLERDKVLEVLKIIEQKTQDAVAEKPNFRNISYWFSDDAITELSKIKTIIGNIQDEDIKNFFLVSFSETVRKVSWADHGEFKLLRDKNKQNKKIDPLQVFVNVSSKNINLLSDFYEKHNATGRVLELSVRNILDVSELVEKPTLIITSPPYGDAKTTVAYGQFSRLSLQWLGIEEDVDKKALGSKPKPIQHNLPSETLYDVLASILNKDPKRAKDVFSFFYDLYGAIKILSRCIRDGGYICFVVGNRRVRGVDIPTNIIVRDFFNNNNIIFIDEVVRSIHNKRMPAENSPSNVKGDKHKTILEEHILIFRKPN